MVLISIFFLEGAYAESKHIKFQKECSKNLMQKFNLDYNWQGHRQTKSLRDQRTSETPDSYCPTPSPKVLTQHPACKLITVVINHCSNIQDILLHSPVAEFVRRNLIIGISWYFVPPNKSLGEKTSGQAWRGCLLLLTKDFKSILCLKKTLLFISPLNLGLNS